ncbi:MAG: thermonuclease family protein [Bacteroidetes bacterium]|nr:thermonuclease family protein [Bacteroidota bacterium]MBX7047372.1 thermonuclease family protein [Ignavibacteria bacterium]
MTKLAVKSVSTLITLAIIGYIAYKYISPKLESVEKDNQSDYLVVERVVDGDTFKMANGEKIRLLGIDTPEKFQSNKLDKDAKKSGQDKKTIQTLGQMASDYVKKIAEGKRVRLVKEPGTDKDKYGRSLRYVYLEDGTLLNAKIIQDGYASVYPTPISKIEEFRKYEREARENKRGLWGDVKGLKQFE